MFNVVFCRTRMPDGVTINNSGCEQGAACCNGCAEDCTSLSDPCNNGVCRGSDGVCIKQPKENGTGCNADNDSCTAGDSCQNGVCTAGAGVNCSQLDDVCNTGTCRTTDGSCFKAPKADGIPCGQNRVCQGGRCEDVACGGLGATCTPGNNTCCPELSASCAALAPNCPGGGDTRCCLETGETCGNDCNCCGLAGCEGSKCCNQTGGACQTATDCCTRGVLDPTCVSGECCVLDGQYCDDENDCCTGICSDNACQGCLPLRARCDGANQCCQTGGETLCRDTTGSGQPACCHPKGGTCSSNSDCCDGRACNSQGRCCEGESFRCDSNADCCNGLECRSGICRSNICRVAGEACPAGTACCAGNGTCSGGTCCHQIGQTCLQTPGVGSPCCGNETECGGGDGATCCIRDFAGIGGGAGQCSRDDQCCSGYCYDARNVCCRPQGAPCTEIGPLGGECCIFEGLTCSSNGAGTCIPCRKPGQSCSGSGVGTCCVGSACQNGVCVVETCGEGGALCQVNETCCPGFGCTSGGVCVFLCVPEGERCVPGVFPCCSGTQCLGDVGSERCRRP